MAKTKKTNTKKRTSKRTSVASSDAEPRNAPVFVNSHWVYTGPTPQNKLHHPNTGMDQPKPLPVWTGNGWK